MMRTMLVAATALGLPACAVLRPQADATAGIARVNPSSIAADPARFDGRQVELTGLLVWEFENLGLYQSYGAYCRRGDRVALYVDWSQWPGVTRADTRRQVTVRGIFRNRIGVTQPDGSILVSNGAPGAGPLEPGSVVRWLSVPHKACPTTR